MKSRRGATSSPISSSRACSAASTLARRDPAQGAGRRVHRGVGQLVGVHLAEPLVALDLALDLGAAAVDLAQLGLHLLVAVGVDRLLGAAHLDPVQRRHGGVEPAGLDHRPHVAGEQRDEQAADVGAVDVRVGRDDDLAVAHRVEVEGPAGAGTDHLDDRRALGVLQHLRDAGLLDVEDLAAQRQQRLELAVARQLAGAEGAVPLDQPQLGAGGVGRAAVGQLGRQRAGLQRGLAPGRVLGGLGRLPGLGRLDDLLEHGRGPAPCACGRPGTASQPPADDVRDDLGDAGGAELVLGLPEVLRLRHLHRHDGGEPLEDVVLDERRRR